MSSDDTMRMGEQSPPRQPQNEDNSAKVVDPGETPTYQSPPPAVSQTPLEGYRPQATGAAKTEILSKSNQVMAWLAVKSGPRAGRLYRLSPEVTAIGRDSYNDFIIDDSAVSRKHAEIQLKRGGEGEERFYIRDLASANGTFVNGRQIVRETLYDGDEVEIGRTVLVFKQMDGPVRGAEAPVDEEGSAARGSAAEGSDTLDLKLV